MVVCGKDIRFNHCALPGGVGHNIVSNRLEREPHLVRTMGNDRVNKGMQQTRLDQYTVQNVGASVQKDPPATSDKGTEPTGAQILAAIESSSRAMQTQIAAIAVDVNLLTADLRVVAERSVATEQKVTCMQSDVDILKASVATLEAQTHKLEAHVKDAEGRARRCNLRVVGFPEGVEGADVEAFLEDWIQKSLPTAPLSAVFVVERAVFVGESSRRPRGPEEVRTAAPRSTRLHRAGCGSEVIVRSDGTLNLERRRQEREEAELLVQTVTSEASSRSSSPCVASGLSPEGEAEVT
ncbi:hypothetical protein NDU88_006358 [Pleurodeles waltl]|uniref:Uncharacterized protein n=1 Tax=Pleurodeles waltl TaxID=8319 RepID=A0AAV7X3X8_PLEWA|nr:hypothetical protein NDU88_006358 [Pleurodeles waltl]